MANYSSLLRSDISTYSTQYPVKLDVSRLTEKKKKRPYSQVLLSLIILGGSFPSIG